MGTWGIIRTFRWSCCTQKTLLFTLLTCECVLDAGRSDILALIINTCLILKTMLNKVFRHRRCYRCSSLDCYVISHWGGGGLGTELVGQEGFWGLALRDDWKSCVSPSVLMWSPGAEGGGRLYRGSLSAGVGFSFCLSVAGGRGRGGAAAQTEKPLAAAFQTPPSCGSEWKINPPPPPPASLHPSAPHPLPAGRVWGLSDALKREEQWTPFPSPPSPPTPTPPPQLRIHTPARHRCHWMERSAWRRESGGVGLPSSSSSSSSATSFFLTAVKENSG